MALRISCPSCGTAFQLDESMTRHPIRCSHCSCIFRLNGRTVDTAPKTYEYSTSQAPAKDRNDETEAPKVEKQKKRKHPLGNRQRRQAQRTKIILAMSLLCPAVFIFGLIMVILPFAIPGWHDKKPRIIITGVIFIVIAIAAIVKGLQELDELD
ncbi:MAG: zinc-ribbon domain-containing protein [Gemmatales bacterium]